MFLGGEESHAFTKGPLLPPPGQSPAFDPSGTYAEETLWPADPDEQVWRVGRLAVWAVTRLFDIEPEDLLYARVDVIGGRDDPRLLELELVEPSLGFRSSPPMRGPVQSVSSHSVSSARCNVSGSGRCHTAAPERSRI